MRSAILVNLWIKFLNHNLHIIKCLTFQILLFAIVSLSIAVPIVPGLVGGNDDVLPPEAQINPANLINFFLRFLLSDETPRQRTSINAADLVQIAGRFLGGLTEGGVRDEIVQDPRVLNYEQEINRRNQLSRLARVFTSILL